LVRLPPKAAFDTGSIRCQFACFHRPVVIQVEEEAVFCEHMSEQYFRRSARLGNIVSLEIFSGPLEEFQDGPGFFRHGSIE
jgi:hypothetical protein